MGTVRSSAAGMRCSSRLSASTRTSARSRRAEPIFERALPLGVLDGNQYRAHSQMVGPVGDQCPLCLSDANLFLASSLSDSRR